jgi:hypothetical protein
MTARDAGLKHHFIADTHPGHECANFADNAGDIIPQNVRQRNLDSWQSISHPHIEVIQSARVHFHEHLIRFDYRIGDFGEFEDLGPAVLFEDDCFHQNGKGQRGKCKVSIVFALRSSLAVTALLRFLFSLH